MTATTATATASSLVVSEVFGPTFQGEGPHIGHRVAFVRLGGCNLSCSWCDTPYTWDASRFDLHDELVRVPVDDVLDQVAAMDVGRVVVSGGEPLLWQDKPGWLYLLEALADMGIAVEVETNGTLEPNEATQAHVELFNVSPKLHHSGDELHRRIRRKPLEAFGRLSSTGGAVLKVVVQVPEDVAAAARLAQAAGFPRATCYVMPEGTSTDELAGRADLADAALRYGLNMTTRLHVLVWGEERGR